MTAHRAVSRTWATFRIWGGNFSPDEITTRLRLTPTKSFKIGDKRGKDGRLKWGHNYWGLTSENQIVSTDLEHHIAWLLDRLEPVQDELRLLMELPEVHADLFCFWEFESMNAGIELSPALIERIGKLNLRLGLDIYFAS